MPKQAETRETIKVRVLYSHGCPNMIPTIELIEAMAAELALGIELSVIPINTLEQAHAESFLGSPTVQVNGSDVEVAARGSQASGLT
jgi:hypothetical protein